MSVNSHIICVFGPKDGVGKSILSSNLACSLAQMLRQKVLIIDADLHNCGDLATLFGFQPSTSLSELLPKADKLLPSDIERMIPVSRFGFSLLPAVKQLSTPFAFETHATNTCLDVLQSTYPIIIIDCGSVLDEFRVQLCERSSLILFCTTPEILSLNRSIHSLQSFQQLAFPTNSIQVIVNRFTPKGTINDALIVQKLKRPVLAFLPEDTKEVEASVNQGLPLHITNPKALFSRVMDDLAHAILTRNLLQPIQISASKKTSHPKVNLDLATQVDERLRDKEATRMEALRLKIHQKLIDVMDFKKLSPEEFMRQDTQSLEHLKQKTREAIFSIIDQMPEISSRDERQLIAKEVLDEAVGLGPLEDMLADPEISEIMVNRYNQIYVEKKGKLTRLHTRFSSDKNLMGVIERIVAPIGRRIDEKTPMVDARLRDGSRVHAIIPPLAIDGPMVTIRKFSKKAMTPKNLVEMGALTDEIADFLRACVEAKLNILVSGGTGSGKTTLLNVLSSFIPSEDRIITVEDSAELKLSQEHVGRLESRPANLQGEGAIPIRELVRNTLRMRPDRIIIGECRGAEALDMLQAMNTGHDGSMATIHSNTPKDCISRLETLVMFAGMDLPSRAIREQIASAVQVIVQLSRLSDGSRKITNIAEVYGIEDGQVLLQDIFVFKEKGLDAQKKVKGSFVATGLVPHFATIFEKKGIPLPKGLFHD